MVACNTLCQACSAAKTGGADGSCANVLAGQDPDSDCSGNAGTDVCDGAGACRQVNGMPCAGPNNCLSDHCEDGVCCDTACAGTCVACSSAKKGTGPDGVCGPIPANTDPDNDCPSEPPATCGLTGNCDGGGGCAKHPSGTACIQATCAGTIAEMPHTCDGAGTCLPSGSEDCAPYGCAEGTCSTICSPALACAPGADCVADKCTFDPDSDGHDNDVDNCPKDANPLQTNTDLENEKLGAPYPAGDGLGDVCDPDDDNDGILDAADKCPLFPSSNNADSNGDGIGDVCDCTDPEQIDCDDGNACTEGDACQPVGGGVCVSGKLINCLLPDKTTCPLLKCKVWECNPANAVWSPYPKPDGTPCGDGGVCIAGGCFPEDIQSSSSTGSASGGAGGIGGTGGTGGTGGSPPLGGAGGSGATTGTSTGATAGAGGFAGGGAAGTGSGDNPAGEADLRLHGGCVCSSVSSPLAPTGGATWIGLGLLLALRRRWRTTPCAVACSAPRPSTGARHDTVP
jgi:MYXO-CTERM domain-containing protein